MEAVALIEADGRQRVGPGADESWLFGELAEMGEKRGADSLPLAAGADVSMADESDVGDICMPMTPRTSPALSKA